MKKRLYEVSTRFLGADGPTEFYFDTKEKAKNFLEKCHNGEINEVIAESDTEINYSDGCYYHELCGWGGDVKITNAYLVGENVASCKDGTQLFYLFENEEEIVYFFGEDGCFYESDTLFLSIRKLEDAAFDKSLLTKEFFEGNTDFDYEALGEKLTKKLFDFLENKLIW